VVRGGVVAVILVALAADKWPRRLQGRAGLTVVPPCVPCQLVSESRLLVCEERAAVADEPTGHFGRGNGRTRLRLLPRPFRETAHERLQRAHRERTCSQRWSALSVRPALNAYSSRSTPCSMSNVRLSITKTRNEFFGSRRAKPSARVF